MDRVQIIKYRDNLHWEIVRHITRLTKDNHEFDINLNKILRTTTSSGCAVEVSGIDGETCRLIVDKSDGYNFDYPKLPIPDLEELHRMVQQKEYQIICLT
jgi:hypothetical protein